MPDDNELEARIQSLEQQVEDLKNMLGAFAIGLDKVSEVQANNATLIEGLIQASETQVEYLRRLNEVTEKNNSLLTDVLNKLLD